MCRLKRHNCNLLMLREIPKLYSLHVLPLNRFWKLLKPDFFSIHSMKKAITTIYRVYNLLTAYPQTAFLQRSHAETLI